MSLLLSMQIYIHIYDINLPFAELISPIYKINLNITKQQN